MYIEVITLNSNLAAQIAPAIRMLINPINPPTVRYEETAVSQGSQSPQDGCISLVAEDIEEIYAELREKVTSDTHEVSVKNVGTFKVTPDSDRKKTGRLAGKISIVTGSAQGFGEGVAGHMASEGAHIVVADLNLELSQERADYYNAQFGPNTATAIAVDISNEESVENLINTTLLTFGGLDIFVANAGVLRAGALDEMDLKSFEFVTRVNYTGYYLCVKHAAVPMKIQHMFAPEYMADIVQVNSKSGLEGSQKNFAYAGSKFGGIGLTQSFAKELVEFNIKVNSICPGNYYEGPLWSDPENGLFAQYLKAGKVPGAKTFEDVKRFYENKVPMRKGCNPIDVARALYYCVEQRYETGQAIPVTGGQTMLN